MEPSQDLEQALREILPIELHHRVPQLVSLLKESMEEAKATSLPQNKSVASPELQKLLESLAGKELQANQALFSFGSGNQIGDVTIRDFAGRDINNSNTINLKIDNYTIHHRTYTTRKSTSRPRRKLETISISKEGTPSKRPSNTTITQRATSNLSRSSNLKSPSAIANDFFIGLKVLSFTVIGFLFGWYGTIFITNTQYLYPMGHEFSGERLIGALITGALGLVTGMSFISKRRRASGIAWWGHILGFGLAGTISYASLRDITEGMFWIGGVILWFIFWLAVLGGYKEFR